MDKLIKDSLTVLGLNSALCFIVYKIIIFLVKRELNLLKEKFNSIIGNIEKIENTLKIYKNENSQTIQNLTVYIDKNADGVKQNNVELNNKYQELKNNIGRDSETIERINTKLLDISKITYANDKAFYKLDIQLSTIQKSLDQHELKIHDK